MSTYEEQLKAIQHEKKAWPQTLDRHFASIQPPTWLKGPTTRGISVIIASHDSEDLLRACLRSLEAQSLDATLVEWILVFNGPKRARLLDVSRTFGTNVKVVRLEVEEANVSLARNRGLEAATRQYITFLDEDDTLSPTYLERLYEQALPNRIVIADIQDRDPLGNALPSPLHKEFERLAGATWSYEQMAQLLTLNACKLIPHAYATRISYDATLRSGEDVVYFSTLFATYTPKVVLLPRETDAVYYRQVREHSVSRQALGEAFSIRQRLAVIRALDAIPTNEQTKRLIERKIDAQTSMMSLFYKVAPEQRLSIRQQVREASLQYFSFSILNQHAATGALVVGDKLDQLHRLVDRFDEDMILRVYLFAPFTRSDVAKQLHDDQVERLTFANMSWPNWSKLPEVCYSVGDVRAASLCTEYQLGDRIHPI